MFKNIPNNVVILGLVSLFNDIASEMIYPIVPIFLTSVLGAPVSLVGLIEGVAEATASSMQLLFGYLSDKVQKRKIFVVSGYSCSALSKLLIAAASSWHFVLFARFIDRFGKGLRTAARDSLLLQSATERNKGFIFGFHRAMDSLGAVIGPLLALVLLSKISNLRQIFFLAFFPGVVSILLLILFVFEKKHQRDSYRYQFRFTIQNIDKGFLFFLVVSICFALGNSSDAFLILRSKQLGLTTFAAVLAYVIYNASQTLFAAPAGKLADIFGAKTIYMYGLLVFAVVYFLFGIVTMPILLYGMFFIYGMYIAATDGVSKAYIAEFIQEKESGTYFGLYKMSIAAASFFASFIGGILWSVINPSATFFYGAILAFFSFLLLLFGKRLWSVNQETRFSAAQKLFSQALYRKRAWGK